MCEGGGVAKRFMDPAGPADEGTLQFSAELSVDVDIEAAVLCRAHVSLLPDDWSSIETIQMCYNRSVL